MFGLSVCCKALRLTELNKELLIYLLTYLLTYLISGEYYAYNNRKKWRVSYHFLLAMRYKSICSIN